MVFALKKLQLRHEWHAPPLNLSPATSTSPISDVALGALPPLKDALADQEASQRSLQPRVTGTAAQDAAQDALKSSNGVEDSFACLDRDDHDESANEALLPVPRELQCRYRKGKCSQRRTFKKNGSLHCFCEHHRQRSIRNQKAFDDKRRRQRQRQRQRQQRNKAEAFEASNECPETPGPASKRPRLSTQQSQFAIV